MQPVCVVFLTYLLGLSRVGVLASSVCPKIYEGGCANFAAKKIAEATDRRYSVAECSTMCNVTLSPRCAGFYYATATGFCSFVTSGCVQSVFRGLFYYDCVGDIIPTAAPTNVRPTPPTPAAPSPPTPEPVKRCHLNDSGSFVEYFYCADAPCQIAAMQKLSDDCVSCLKSRSPTDSLSCVYQYGSCGVTETGQLATLRDCGGDSICQETAIKTFSASCSWCAIKHTDNVIPCVDKDAICQYSDNALKEQFQACKDPTCQATVEGKMSDACAACCWRNYGDKGAQQDCFVDEPSVITTNTIALITVGVVGGMLLIYAVALWYQARRHHQSMYFSSNYTKIDFSKARSEEEKDDKEASGPLKQPMLVNIDSISLKSNASLN